MRELIENSRKALASKKAQMAAGASALVASGMSQAAIPLSDVQTGITTAVASGETVGGYVMVGVAALVVVGLIVGIIKKL